MQLYRQLAHLPPSAFSTLKGSLDGIPKGGILKADSRFSCDACMRAKFIRTIPKTRTTKARSIFETVHTDICGPFSHETPTRSRYFIYFLDEFSHYSLIRFFQTRDETPKALMDMVQLVERQYDVKVKKIQCDNAGEFFSTKFKEQLRSLGIQQKFSIAYIHKTNGTAEPFNRTICGSARALLYHSQLPSTLWAEAVAHGTFTKNRIPHAALNGTTPFTIVSKHRPSLATFHASGAPVSIYIQEERRRIARKLLPRSEAAYLVGYGEERNQYCFWVPEERKIHIAQDFKPRSLSASPVVSHSVYPNNQEYEIYHTPFPLAEAIVPAGSSTPSSSSVNNHIQPTKESTATFRPPTCSELRIRYPALFPKSEECSSQDPMGIIIGEFPTTESLPPSPVPPSPSTQAPPVNQATVPSSRVDSETSELELDTEELTEPEPTVTCAGRTIKPPNRYGLTAEYALLMPAVQENPDEPTLQ